MSGGGSFPSDRVDSDEMGAVTTDNITAKLDAIFEPLSADEAVKILQAYSTKNVTMRQALANNNQDSQQRPRSTLFTCCTHVHMTSSRFSAFVGALGAAGRILGSWLDKKKTEKFEGLDALWLISFALILLSAFAFFLHGVLEQCGFKNKEN